MNTRPKPPRGSTSAQLTHDVQAQIAKYLPAADLRRLCAVSPVFLRAALRERYARVHLDLDSRSSSPAFGTSTSQGGTIMRRIR
jgi:hypothetical protein